MATTREARGSSHAPALASSSAGQKCGSRRIRCRAAHAGHRASTAEHSDASPGSKFKAVQRFWNALQADSHIKKSGHINNGTKEEEVAQLHIQILTPASQTASLHQPSASDGETADEFFRDKGAATPALIALSLLNKALSPFGLEQSAGRSASKALRGGPSAEDWSSYQKYDIFHQLLTSSPLLKTERFAPLQALLQASPRSGPGKYDFIRSLLSSISSSEGEEKEHKWDLVGELLRSGRQAEALQPGLGDTEKVRKYDMVLDLLHALSVHADWQLPAEGLAHNLLHFDDWGSREYDPVAWVFEKAWHENVKPAWDPLVAVLSAEAPTLSARWDPLAALLKAQVPSGKGLLDPIGDILNSAKQAELQRAGDSKYDPLPGLFRAEAQQRGENDALGNFIRSLTHMDLRAVPDAFGDILKGLLDADLSGIADPVGDILAGLNKFANFRSAPDIGGLGSKTRSLSHYFPDLLHEVSPPTGQTPLTALLRNMQASAPLSEGRNKYDPIPSALSASANPAKKGSDPLTSFLKATLRPHQHSKYDPLSAESVPASELSGNNRSRSSTVLPQASAPEGASKYDPLPGILSADAEPVSEQQLDLLRGLLKAQLPSGDSKYDPLKELLSSEGRLASEGRLDLLRGLLKTNLPSGDSKYDPLQQLLSSEGQPASEGRLDLLRGLLNAKLPSGDSKYDPLKELLSSEGQPFSVGRLDMLRGLLRTELPSGDSRYDPLPELLSSEAHQTSGERLGFLQALLRAQLPRGDSKYDPAPQVLAAEPQHKQNGPQSLFSLRAPNGSSKFDPLKETLRNLRNKTAVKEAHHSQAELAFRQPEDSPNAAATPGSPSYESAGPSRREQQPSGSGWAAATPNEGGSLRGEPLSQKGATELGNALSAANQQGLAASEPGVFDPSFVRALKGQFSESQSPDTGFPMDARDPRLRPDQKANLISMQPPSERPFAAGSGPGWLEEASTSQDSSKSNPAVVNLDAAVAKVDAALEKTERLQENRWQVGDKDDPVNKPPTSAAISPNPIRRFLGRWPWWSAESKAQAAGKMQPSERPFAKDARKKGWLEEASTPLGRVKAPGVPEHYKQTKGPKTLQTTAGSTETLFPATPLTASGEGGSQILSAEARAQAVSKQAESDRPFAISSSSKGWLEIASQPLEPQNLTPLPSTASSSEPPPASRQSQPESSEKHVRAQTLDTEQQVSPSSLKRTEGSLADETGKEEGNNLPIKENGGKVTEAMHGSPLAAEAVIEKGQKEENGKIVPPTHLKQQDNLAEILPGAEALPLPATKSLSAQLRESRDNAGEAGDKTPGKGPFRMQKPHPKLDSLQQQWQYLQQQSEGLRRKLPAEQARVIAQPEEIRPHPTSQAEREKENAKLRQAEALQRQLLQAEKHRAFLEYDLVPDIFRLRGAMKATPKPVAGYDPMAVLAKRAGKNDVNALASAFRELAADRKLASKHSHLYRIMQASLPVRNPSRSQLTLPSFSRALQGPPTTAITAAENDTGSLLQDIGSSQKYSELHNLLQGRRPETVVGAICALATLLQPAVAAC